MFQSDKVYTNRYRDQYIFSSLEENKYVFKMSGSSMEYCRLGAKEGEQNVNPQDLGMFDPSGGPYVTLGTQINGKKIIHIRESALGMVVTTE